MRSWQTSARGKPARGFTLLEVLVGIGVFSLVVLALFAGMRIAGRGVDTAEGRSVTTSGMRIADGFIRRYVSQAFPAWEREEERTGARRNLQFEGSENQLRFVAVMPPHLGVGGLHEVILTVHENAEEQRLTVRRALVHPEFDREELAEDERVLIDGVLRAQFAYFGSVEKESSPQWHETWRGMARFPSLVRLRVTTRDAGSWPDLVIPLRADSVRIRRPAVAGNRARPAATRSAPTAPNR